MRRWIMASLLGLIVFTVRASDYRIHGTVTAGQTPEGLSKSDWAGIREAHAEWQHRFQAVEGDWLAHNPGQQWLVKFDGRGFLTQPVSGGWQWGLKLRQYGFAGAEHVVSGKAAVEVEGQRLSYGRDAVVQEWFVNDTRGLEHGYTVRDRPTGGAGALIFELETCGTLTPRVVADGDGIEFRDVGGATVINYSGLKVTDADGKTLASRFECRDARHPSVITLLLDERGARYPLTIDPVAQQAYLKADNTGAGDCFGCSIAVSGDTVVVGAGHEGSSTTGVNSTPNDSAPGSGAVYIFVHSGATWTQQAYLKASNTSSDWAGDWFGAAVAISGDTVVVGAPNEDSSETGVNSTPNDSADNSGAVYVFNRVGTTWAQQAYLKAHNTGAGDYFGNSVAVSGDTVVVGAWGEDSSTTGVNSTSDDGAISSGAAYVFTRIGTTWTQQAYLKASNTGAGDYFGESVAVLSDTVVVGAWGEDSSTTGVNSTPNDSARESGAAYVFTRVGTTWVQQAYLKASNTGIGDRFGGSVAVSGYTVVVGAPNECSSTTGVNSTPNDSAISSGAAYVFTRIGTTWTQQAYLKASNTGADDYFGRSVAVAGDTVVVGAENEGSSTTGVNSTPDNSANNAGAAYVFTRSWPRWVQVAYLKASNTGAGDSFGTAVAISGDTVVVGALGEDSSATGVNSTTNDSAGNSGAAYVFTGFGANTAPVVSTPTSANVTSSSATLGGYVISGGGAEIIARGVVLAPTSSNNNPKLGGSGVTNVTAPGTIGVFTVDICSLLPGTSYSFAAYANNGLGISYSATGSFTVGLPDSPCSATYYVDINRPDDSGSGRNWATAKKSLQSAIDLASLGDSVIVADGTYASISTDNKAIAIQSVYGPEVTIIDGGMTNRCATLGGAPTHTNTVLNGFTLRSGYDDYSGGGSAFGTLNNCIITGCLAGYRNPDFQLGFGGGAYYGILNKCALTGNSAYWYGGGAYGSSLNNCAISGNRAWHGAGSAWATVNNSVLSGNFANRIDSNDSGSGGTGSGSLRGVLNNCLIINNQAAQGGGAQGSELNNCTITGNRAWFNSLSCGGGAKDSTLNNCIVWGNISRASESNYASCTFSYSCTSPLPSGAGNIEADPMFDSVKGNGHLLRGSPCIDSGDNALAQGLEDMDGAQRVFNGTIDMGAYEFIDTTVTLHPGDHGSISNANSGADYVVTVTNGAAFPAVMVNADDGWRFIGWNPPPPVTVTNDFEATAEYAVATNTLIVVSAHGTPVPGVGTNHYASEASVECRVSGDEESATTRYLCTGWTGAGSVPPAGTATNVSFTITNDSAIVWQWATEYRLTAGIGGGQGWLSVTGAWCAAGSTTAVSAVAADGWRFNGWLADGAATNGTAAGGGTNTVAAGMDAPHALTAVFAALGLPEALDNDALVWTTGGASNWVGQTLVTTDGVDAAASGPLGDNVQSWLETTVATGGTLSFAWRVSSEAQRDLLRFEVDGHVHGLISGETVWQTVSVTVPYGAHTFRWTYAKGKSGAAGVDRGWVDQVVWAPLPPLTLAVALDATNLVWQTGGDAAWLPQAEMSVDGVAAAQTGPVGDSGWTYLTTRVRGPGVLFFYWSVSCEEEYDWLVFLVDGVVQRAVTGESGWQSVQIALSGEGDHELRWEYWKDESVSEGLDAGWLDRVSWSGAVPPQSGFVLWLADRGLSGDAALLFAQDRDGDGVANGFEYAFGTNAPAAGPLLTIQFANGRPVVETPEPDSAASPYVDVRVLGSTNLINWDLPVVPAVDTTGKPSNRAWYELDGVRPERAFFKLEAELK